MNTVLFFYCKLTTNTTLRILRNYKLVNPYWETSLEIFIIPKLCKLKITKNITN